MRTAIFVGLLLTGIKMPMTEARVELIAYLGAAFIVMDVVDFALNVYDKLRDQ
jgi:hypothetical protein